MKYYDVQEKMRVSYLVKLISQLSFVAAFTSCAPGTDDAPSGSLPAQSQAIAGAGSTPIAGAGAASPTTTAASVGGGPSIGMTLPATPALGGVAGRAAMTAVAGSAGKAVNVAASNAGAGGSAAAGSAGTHAGAGNTGIAAAGTGAASSEGGPCGSGTPTDGRPTTGPMACIVEQHNATRAMVKAATPLEPVTWDVELAKYAQEWTDMTCMSPQHRMQPSMNGKPLGENLYASGGPDTMPGKQAVDGWSGEVACYTFGAFTTTDKCDMSCTSKMHSDGCGHYTQVVWRTSTKIGCGVTTCGSGFNMQTEVICNYSPAGNYRGENPY